MAAKLISPFLLVLILALSCAEDDVANALMQEQETETDTLNVDSIDALNLDSTFQHCDSLFIATYHGTACCISGPTVAKPGDILRYHYQMNHKDAQVSWQILEGDMSIIAGQDTHTITVRFGPDFTTGLISGRGNGLKEKENVRLECYDRVIVTGE